MREIKNTHNPFPHDDDDDDDDDVRRAEEEEEMTKSLHDRAEEVFLGWANDWARCVILNVKKPVVSLLVKLTRSSAMHPKTWIVSVIVLSIFMLVSAIYNITLR